MDETNIKVKGQWRCLCRVVDKSGHTTDFPLTEQRDERAALCFLIKAIRRHGVPEKVTIDGSEGNAAAIRSNNEARGTAIEIRQVKNLNNLVEQDHRAAKRVTRPMLGFKSFEAAQATLVSIELMHMLKKGQLVGEARVEDLTARSIYRTTHVGDENGLKLLIIKSRRHWYIALAGHSHRRWVPAIIWVGVGLDS